jgi:hypothetical protein
MDAQTSTWSDLGEGALALAVLAAGFYAYNFISSRITASKYPDYDRHLTYQETMFIEGEFDRVKAYSKQNQYPVWFHFIWLRDVALIFLTTLAVILLAYLAVLGVKMFTGGLVETAQGGTGFKTGAYAPVIASIFGIFAGVWVTVKISTKSEHYGDFAQYVATLSRKRAIRHLEHFYRARLITHEWLTQEHSLLVMIYERYTPTLYTALKITAGLTALVFAFDIWRGL